jgi:hypothetical protein
VIGEIKSLLSATALRLRKARFPNGFWWLFGLGIMALAFFSQVIDVMSADEWTSVTAIILMLAGMIGVTFYVAWILTRHSADFQDRKGAFWPWLGWMLLSLVPAIVAFLLIYFSHDREEFGYAEALAFALLPPLTVPLSVHASGKAIDAAGPSFKEIWIYWQPHYFTLVAASFLLTGPASFLSDMLYIWFGEQSLIVDIASALVYLPALLLGTVLTVEAFHRVPAEPQ